MSDRLPPLTALRAFDAAARHLSFAEAAAELGVTPAALSFQIKSLESHLGAPLFQRLNRAVRLTDAGKMLAPAAEDAFSILARGWQATQRSLSNNDLTVTVGPGFGARFLAPRLYAFAAVYPGIDLRISASLSLRDLEADGLDLAIRFGPGWRSEGVEPLLRDLWTPLAAPDVAARLHRPQDVLKERLLHQVENFVTPVADWAAWFEAVGMPDHVPQGTLFNQHETAISAAAAGAGVVLGRMSMAEAELRDGRLIAPFAESLARDAGYYIVARSPARPNVRLFIDWLRAEAAALHKLAEDRQIFMA